MDPPWGLTSRIWRISKAHASRNAQHCSPAVTRLLSEYLPGHLGQLNATTAAWPPSSQRPFKRRAYTVVYTGSLQTRTKVLFTLQSTENPCPQLVVCDTAAHDTITSGAIILSPNPTPEYSCMPKSQRPHDTYSVCTDLYGSCACRAKVFAPRTARLVLRTQRRCTHLRTCALWCAACAPNTHRHVVLYVHAPCVRLSAGLRAIDEPSQRRKAGRLEADAEWERRVVPALGGGTRLVGTPILDPAVLEEGSVLAGARRAAGCED